MKTFFQSFALQEIQGGSHKDGVHLTDVGDSADLGEIQVVLGKKDGLNASWNLFILRVNELVNSRENWQDEHVDSFHRRRKGVMQVVRAEVVAAERLLQEFQRILDANPDEGFPDLP